VAEREGLQRTLALAKDGLRAPSSARERVRARLGESGPGPGTDPSAGAARTSPDASQAGASGGAQLGRAVRAPWRSLGWMLAGVSIGLCAGYWLGYQRMGAPLAELAATLESAHSSAVSGGLPTHSPTHPLEANSSTTSPAGSRPAAQDAAAQTADRAAPAAIGDASHGAGASQPGGGAPLANGIPTTPDAVLPRSVSAGAARATPRRAPERESLDRFAAEVALLGRAERAIRAGEAALALALLDQLDREFSSSALGVERATARALARCDASRTGSAAERAVAQSAARELLTQGSSLYADRVRKLCGLVDDGENVAIEEAPRRGH
jgi:hypothetical protein